jgi:hypothetical protein
MSNNDNRGLASADEKKKEWQVKVEKHHMTNED